MAMLAGMEIPEYAQLHSTLALHRVAAPAGKLAPHGAPESATINKYLGMRPHRDGACVCYDCIDAWLASKYQTTFFLRLHHVRGLDWCPEHGSALYEVTAPNPFHDLPHLLRDKGMTVRGPAAVRRLPRSGTLQRYTAIATELLSRRCPVSCYALNRILSDRAKDADFCSPSAERPTLISDLVLDTVDEKWLLRHIPEFANKQRGEPFHLFDSIDKHSHNAARGEIYVLALAILYPSTEAALFAIAEAETTEFSDGGRQTRRIVRLTGDDLWFSGMLPLYVEFEGNVEAVAARLGTTSSDVSRVMRSAGVPVFGKLPKSTWHALGRFLAGATIRDACRTAGARSQDLESLVRKCIPARRRSGHS
ncbi:hypothetical protein GCM10027034_37420 [Ramlibacter solisilvae]